MNVWHVAQLGMLAVLALGFWATMRRDDMMRLVGLQFSGVVAAVELCSP